MIRRESSDMRNCSASLALALQDEKVKCLRGDVGIAIGKIAIGGTP